MHCMEYLSFWTPLLGEFVEVLEWGINHSWQCSLLLYQLVDTKFNNNLSNNSQLAGETRANIELLSIFGRA